MFLFGVGKNQFLWVCQNLDSHIFSHKLMLLFINTEKKLLTN